MNAIVDASVFVTAMSDEGGDGEWARAVIESGRLAAPHLLHVEVTHAFRRAVATKAMSADSAALGLGEVLAFPVTLYPFDMAADRVWELRESVSPYDSWYVALAELLELPLATLDRRLARAKGPACEFITP